MSLKFLDISGNGLIGPIHLQLCTLSWLHTLNQHDNSLFDELVGLRFPFVTVLNLSFNQLIGLVQNDLLEKYSYEALLGNEGLSLPLQDPLISGT